MQGSQTHRTGAIAPAAIEANPLACVDALWFSSVIFSDYMFELRFDSGLHCRRVSAAIAYAFRRSDITATVQISRAVGSEVRAAASRRASHAIILGSRELEDNFANVKNLDSKVEKRISFERLVKETAEENARSEGSDEGNLR